MRYVRSRARLGIRIFGVVIGVVAVALVVAGAQSAQIPEVSVRDIAYERLTSGQVVSLRGELVASPSERTFILAPIGLDVPTIGVELDAPGPGFRIGEGSYVAVVGTVSANGHVLDANLISPSPPTKYIEAARRRAE